MEYTLFAKNKVQEMLLKNGSHKKLDSTLDDALDNMFLYDATFKYPKALYIQYLDNYKTDFVFVKEFPKVMAAMSEKMDKQDFRDMLKCAIRTNMQLYNDGKSLNPESGEIIKEKWHGSLFENFLGTDADNYIVRGYEFKGKNPIMRIKNGLKNNMSLCTQILSLVKSEFEYRENSEKSFIAWLIEYNRYFAFSKNYT